MGLKLLYICHHRKHKTFRAGGFGAQLAQRGWTVTLVCIADNARWRMREYDQDQVHYVETPDWLPGRLRSGWDLWNTGRRMGYLRHRRFDLVHAFETRPATIYPVRRLRRRCPVPLVIDWVDWWGRGGLIQEQRPRWYQWLFGALETYYEEHFRTQAQATTVISHGLGQRAVRLGVDPQTIYWIPSASDVHRIQPVAPGAHRTAFGLGPDRFILGFSALDVTLGLDLVLAALRAVLPRCPEVLLVMTGKQSRAIDDAIARHDLAAQVRHFGLLPYADYERLVACTDVFLLPFVDTVANRGRWPGRIRDAMAAARPVVSNPVGEMQILLTQEEIGLLAEETPQDMAAQILRLRQDPELRRRLGENARRLAETRFSMKQVTDDLERCYRETLERAKPARSPGSRMQAHPPRSTTTATG